MHRLNLIGGIAVLFGTVTVLSGGTVLWGPQAVSDAAGDIVVPILWFNFLSGVAYIFAGAGIILGRSWAAGLSRIIAVAIALMLAVLLVMILAGTPWEFRTVVAMAIRLAFWLIAARAASKMLPRAAGQR